jgi:DNA polymerase III subunit delta
MIIYIYGTDTFRSKQYLNRTIEEFRKKRDPQGYNVVVLDGKTEESGKIIGEIKSSPFLAEKRMIIINNVLSGKDKDLLASLMELAKNNQIPDSNIIVFWQGDNLGRVKEVKELEKLLKKEKYNQEFNLLKGMQLDNWIKQEVESRGGSIKTDAVSYLSQNAGYDMWFLNSLIDQLNNYQNNKVIEIKDIQLFLDEKIDDNVFNMVEAVVSGDKKQATKLLNEQRRLGEDDFKLFGLILWQFRILLEMRDLFEREDGIPTEQMAKKLGIHPFVVKKNLYIIKRFSLSKLKQIHKQLLEIDYKVKTGLGDQSLLIDLFIQKA